MLGGQATLVLVGGGPELLALQKLSQEIGIEAFTRFLGYRPREDLKHYLAASQLFLFASQTETQGLVVLEAAAAGLPILAVRASGVNETVIDQQTGCLVDPGQQSAFAQGHAGTGAQPQPKASFRTSLQ